MTARLRQITFIGIFIAMIIGLGYALALVPNIELVTALVFLSGVLMGFRKGLVVAIIGEFLFSALNPIGSGLLFPPMLISQVIAMAIISTVGALMRSFILKKSISVANTFLIAATGFGVTLLYDVLVSAAYPLSAGFGIRETIATIITGVSFSLLHLIANTFIFVFFIPLTARKVAVAIPYFQKTALGNSL